MSDDDGIDDEWDDAGDHDRVAEREHDAHLVGAALAGDPDAFAALYDRWFERVHHLVAGIVHDREGVADTCQDAFLAAWRSLSRLQDHHAFGGWLLRIARNAAYDRSAAGRRSRPVDGEELAMIEHGATTPAVGPAGFTVTSRLATAEDPEVAASDAEVAALVREVVATLGPRDAEVLDLQLRLGLTPAEVGEVVGINRNAANQLCHRVRKRFASAFGARMLWGARGPACAVLAAEVRAAGREAFDAEAVRLAEAHLARCADCEERRRMRLRPAQLFAALPLLPVAAGLRAEVAAALAGAGVPMGPAAVPATTGPGPGIGTQEAPGGAPPRPDPGRTVGDGSPSPASVPEGSLAHGPAGGTSGPARWRPSPRATVAALAAAVLVALVAVVAGVLGGDDEPALVEAAGRGTTASTLARAGGPEPSSSVAPSSDPGASIDVDGLPAAALPDGPHVPGPGPAGPAPGSTAPPGTTGPAGPGGPAGPPAPAPTAAPPLPPPVVELLELAPDEPRGVRYVIGRASPVLTWAVRDAAAAEVWLLREQPDGTEERIRALATGTSGTLDVCPGTVEGVGCTSTPGTYAFEVVAANADGVVVRTPPTARPRLVILEPVIP